MKREIKFRAWDNVDYMSNPFTLMDIQNGKIEFTRDCKIMQFTGLIDKNGKDIYEGDILSFVTRSKYGHQVDGKLVYTKPVEFGRFCIKENSLYVFTGFHIDGHAIQYLMSYEAVVAGNEFENPELLNPLPNDTK